MKINFYLVVIVFLLFAKNAKAQDIFDAVRKDDTLRILALIKINPDTINSKNENGFTPLIIASYHHRVESVKILLKHGANVNANSPEGTALVAAVYKNDFETTTLLLNNKALPDSGNEEGVNSLMYAAMNNNMMIIKLLLKAGADKHLVSKNGQTAFSLALKYGHTEISNLLAR